MGFGIATALCLNRVMEQNGGRVPLLLVGIRTIGLPQGRCL